MTAEETFQALLQEAGARHCVSPADILGRGRTKAVMAARRWAMAECRERWGWSYPEVGKAFGRDHSTVMAAIKPGVREAKHVVQKLRGAA